MAPDWPFSGNFYVSFAFSHVPVPGRSAFRGLTAGYLLFLPPETSHYRPLRVAEKGIGRAAGRGAGGASPAPRYSQEVFSLQQGDLPGGLDQSGAKMASDWPFFRNFYVSSAFSHVPVFQRR